MTIEHGFDLAEDIAPVLPSGDNGESKFVSSNLGVYQTGHYVLGGQKVRLLAVSAGKGVPWNQPDDYREKVWERYNQWASEGFARINEANTTLVLDDYVFRARCIVGIWNLTSNKKYWVGMGAHDFGNASNSSLWNRTKIHTDRDGHSVYIPDRRDFVLRLNYGHRRIDNRYYMKFRFKDYS